MTISLQKSASVCQQSSQNMPEKTSCDIYSLVIMHGLCWFDSRDGIVVFGHIWHNTRQRRHTAAKRAPGAILYNYITLFVRELFSHCSLNQLRTFSPHFGLFCQFETANKLNQKYVVEKC